ncbi:hypothetical protein FDECE_14215 [Fusarium decemcellulare]|nr:hypothetical protein FDECE_14215 [Fusarium decemcellulare]
MPPSSSPSSDPRPRSSASPSAQLQAKIGIPEHAQAFPSPSLYRLPVSPPSPVTIAIHRSFLLPPSRFCSSSISPALRLCNTGASLSAAFVPRSRQRFTPVLCADILLDPLPQASLRSPLRPPLPPHLQCILDIDRR